jgi:hypothetical protein
LPLVSLPPLPGGSTAEATIEKLNRKNINARLFFILYPFHSQRTGLDVVENRTVFKFEVRIAGETGRWILSLFLDAGKPSIDRFFFIENIRSFTYNR